MAFEEDLSVFTDIDGFAVSATLAGVAREVIFDAPGADVLDGQVVTTEPSVLVAASAAPARSQSLVVAAGLPLQLAHLAGTYTVRTVDPEPPDGAFCRLMLVKVS